MEELPEYTEPPLHPKLANSWRDDQGFGRPIEVEPRVFAVVGPDNLSHAFHCQFISLHGILPCDCDRTRRAISEVLVHGEYNWWYRCWIRWATCRVSHWETRPRVPWPNKGPDGDPWVAGVDYNDDEERP